MGAGGQAVGVNEPGICTNLKAIGQSCEKDNECLIGKCTDPGGVRSYTVGKVCNDQKRADGEDCIVPTQCQSGQCTARKCTREYEGAPGEGGQPPANEPPANTPGGTGGAPAAIQLPAGWVVGDKFTVNTKKDPLNLRKQPLFGPEYVINRYNIGDAGTVKNYPSDFASIQKNAEFWVYVQMDSAGLKSGGATTGYVASRYLKK